ncbi:MAG TPA: hypothetical protein VFP68_14110, partial [Burkholderiaceae bacterium]|nr:hypothetical protein [Burkholderiaceae bacterium]
VLGLGVSCVDTDGQSERYREMANELRLLVPKMKDAGVAEQLRLLAVSYERLAEHADAAPYPPQVTDEALL